MHRLSELSGGGKRVGGAERRRVVIRARTGYGCVDIRGRRRPLAPREDDVAEEIDDDRRRDGDDGPEGAGRKIEIPGERRRRRLTRQLRLQVEPANGLLGQSADRLWILCGVRARGNAERKGREQPRCTRCTRPWAIERFGDPRPPNALLSLIRIPPQDARTNQPETRPLAAPARRSRKHTGTRQA